MKKSGFTLMELLVYMAIVGIVVVIAGQAFSNSTKFRVRTDNMIRATQEAENVAMLFKEDVAQMGAKSSQEYGDADGGPTFGVKFSEVNGRVYMDPDNIDEDKKDSSSFLLETKGDYSELTTRRIRYDEHGYFEAVEEVRWYVENKTLKRVCTVIQKATGLTISTTDPCQEGGNAEPVEMATNVTKFIVEAANPGVKEEMSQLFPPNGLPEFRLIPRVGDADYAGFKATNSNGSESIGGDEITLSKFFSNYQNSDDESDGGVMTANQKVNQAFAVRDVSGSDGVWNTMCNDYGKMTLHPDTVYEISFEMMTVTAGDKSVMFVPGVDHMSVGFRKAGSGDYAKNGERILLQDFLFFPPMDESNGAGKRTMRFTVSERIDNVCLAFTFACYSPLVSQGKIKLKNVKVLQVASANYRFDGFAPEEGNNKREKKNVKALRLKLQVSRGAKNGAKGETGDVELVVPTPSNGPRD